MSRERREAQRKFNETLERACKTKIAEEKKLKGRVDALIGEVSVLQTKKTRLLRDLEVEGGKVQEIEEKGIKKQKELNIFLEKVKTERIGIENDRKKLNEMREVLERDKKVAFERMDARQKELKEQEDTTRELIAKNEKILEDIKIQKSLLKQKEDDLTERELNIKELQYQANEKLKKREDTVKKDEARIANIEKEKKEIEARAKNLFEREKTLDKRAEELKTREQSASDREVEQNARQVELDRQERRVNNLNEIIHKGE